MGRMLGPRRCELHLFTLFATRLHQRQLLGEEGRAASTALSSIVLAKMVEKGCGKFSVYRGNNRSSRMG
jgi:hypothetical protein